MKSLGGVAVKRPGFPVLAFLCCTLLLLIMSSGLYLTQLPQLPSSRSALVVAAIPYVDRHVNRAEASSGFILKLAPKPGETLDYTVLISETLYSDGRRSTTLYREAMRIEVVPFGEDKFKQTVSCTGTATVDGSSVRQLSPIRYSIISRRDGRVLQVEGLRPWDSRLMETIWLTQVMLDNGPVKPGDSWAINEETYSTADGKPWFERREYIYKGMENVDGIDSFRIDFTISRSGRRSDGSSTYLGKGSFYIQDGRVLKFDSSEVISVSGKGQDNKAITMVQVTLKKD
ncbi:MAG: hypothetical protein HPY71_01185 [Firmicutes bacterium]|nr:hypothetical protein [Bacillota bacterium]